jgi:hypothetical protein
MNPLTTTVSEAGPAVRRAGDTVFEAPPATQPTTISALLRAPITSDGTPTS